MPGRLSQDALQDPGSDACDGSPTVAFEVELGLEGVVDRLDDLPQRLEVAVCGPRCLALTGRAQQLDVGLGEGGFKRLAVVVLVGHQFLLRVSGNQIRVGGEHSEQHLAFIGLGAGERERHRQPRHGAQQMQAQAPEVAGVRGAVAVLGPAGQCRAFRRFPRAPALDGGGVDHPHIVAAAAGVRQGARTRAALPRRGRVCCSPIALAGKETNHAVGYGRSAASGPRR